MSVPNLQTLLSLSFLLEASGLEEVPPKDKTSWQNDFRSAGSWNSLSARNAHRARLGSRYVTYKSPPDLD